MRFACPNVAGNKGRPVADQLADAREYVAGVEADSPAAVNGPPIPLEPGRVVPWADLYRIVAAISKLLANTTVSFERRWRTVLGLAGFCRGLKYDGGGEPEKAVTGGRLAEMIHLLGQAAVEEAPLEASEVPRPGWVGRMVFRQVAAVYARRDHGPEKGPSLGTPLSRILSAMRFARGGGPVPQTHARIPQIATFEAAEQAFGPLGPESDELLTRYYRVKVESGQFCGPSNFGVPFWEGIESLAVTFPVGLWLANRG
jgi:lysine-N-methylase